MLSGVILWTLHKSDFFSPVFFIFVMLEEVWHFIFFFLEVSCLAG